MWKLTSPDQKLDLVIEQDTEGGLYYSVMKNNSAVLNKSAIRLKTSLGSLEKELEFVKENRSEIKEEYSLPAGKKEVYFNNAAVLELEFKFHEYSVSIEGKAFDDGVAIRYGIRGKTKETLSILSENTDFVFCEEYKDMWLQDWVDTYEGPYNHTAWDKTEGRRFGMPCLFHAKARGSWVMVTEAGLLNQNGSFCSSHLVGQNKNTMKLNFAPEQEEPIKTELPFMTPWRIVIVTDNLNDMLNNTINYNLNPVSTIEDISWIKPGRSIWSWWSFENGAQLFSEQKKYVDFAAALGFESITVDAGWDDTWVKDLCEYAAERNVTVWLWSDMQALDTLEKASEKIPRWASWGVVGLKVDFFMNDSQHTMWQYHMIADIMTQNKLMINFHGSTKPAGEGRTYPNLLTEEGIMGLEHYKWSGMPDAVHNCTVPFTRNVVGAMDYTVTGISNQNRNTTQGHQLAMSVVYESGIQHLADSIYSYEPWIGTEFLRRTYGSYDEMKLLDGFPGEYVIIMRRKGTEWFVGGMTSTARTVKIDLDFLQKGNYTAQLYKDGETEDSLKKEQYKIEKTDELSVDLLENGGFVLYISNGMVPFRSGIQDGYMTPAYKKLYPEEKSIVGQIDFGNICAEKDARQTLRICYHAKNTVSIQVQVNEIGQTVELESSGNKNTIRVTDAIVELQKGENQVSVKVDDEEKVIVYSIDVINYAPEKEIYYSAKEGIVEGDARLLPVPDKTTEESIQGIGANGFVNFNHVLAEEDGEYILLLDYYSGENRYLNISVNQEPAITTVLFNSGGWGPSRWDIIARKEVKVVLKKGENSIRIGGQETEGSHIGRIGVRLEKPLNK